MGKIWSLFSVAPVVRREVHGIRFSSRFRQQKRRSRPLDELVKGENMRRSFLTLALFALASTAWAGGREAVIVQNAAEVLDQSTKIAEKCIPAHLLKEAQGVLVMPNVVKASFIFGGRHGRGVLLVRCKDGGWSNPVFVTLTGGSFGWQGGIQSADLVLVFKTSAGVERLLKGQDKLTLGGDASVAAGPVGRQSSAATDVMLKAEIFSYSRSRGLFLGLSFEGDALRVDWSGNESYYNRRDITPAAIVNGGELPIPESALALRGILAARTNAAPPAVIVPPPVTIQPPR
jgi:lipid-binding SYLF domain-containing protein